MKATREGYGAGLKQAAEKNSQVVALTADLGGSTQAIKIQDVDPKRFFQIGIAEANMVDIAAGMATCGKVPFTSTFAIFGTGRAWESFRNSVAYPGLNVKLACTHSGLSVGEDGASHQALEDISLMRTIPRVGVVVPADYESSRQATLALAEAQGPFYLRLGRAKVPEIYTQETLDFEVGKGVRLKSGKDVALVACGPCVSMALEAAELLQEDSIDACVIDMHTIKPLDQELVKELAEECGCFVSAEEHNVIGGLGSALAEFLAENHPVPLERVGTQDCFGESGDHPSLWKKYGLTSEAIALKAKRAYQRKNA